MVQTPSCHPGPRRILRLLIALSLLALASPGRARGQQSTDLQRLIPPVPTPASFIADVPKLLSAAVHDTADARIREIQGLGLGDIGIAIIPDIGSHAPVDVGVAIYRNWKIGTVAEIGSAHRDVGVLLLIVPKELAASKRGECWITTGNGAEGIITDAASGTICRDVIIPHLKEKDYGGAVLAGIDAIEDRLRTDLALADSTDLAGAGSAVDETDLPQDDGPDFPFVPVGLGGLLSVGGGIGFFRWRRNRPRTCPKCGRQMTRLDESADNAQLGAGQIVEEEIRSVDYDVWECGGCGEHLVIPYRKIFTRYSKCRECGNRTAWSTRRIIMPASTLSSGMAEDTYRCKACPATWKTDVVLPRIQSSSSSSGGSSGGGGSSFGGSGSTSGGGGGGSY